MCLLHREQSCVDRTQNAKSERVSDPTQLRAAPSNSLKSVDSLALLLNHFLEGNIVTNLCYCLFIGRQRRGFGVPPPHGQQILRAGHHQLWARLRPSQIPRDLRPIASIQKVDHIPTCAEQLSHSSCQQRPPPDCHGDGAPVHLLKQHQHSTAGPVRSARVPQGVLEQ